MKRREAKPVQQKLQSPHKRGWVRPSKRSSKKGNGRRLSREPEEFQEEPEESEEEGVDPKEKKSKIR